MARVVSRGESIRYVDGSNVERPAYMRSVSAERATADVVWVSFSGATPTANIVVAVPHWSQAGGPPYWVE